MSLQARRWRNFESRAREAPEGQWAPRFQWGAPVAAHYISLLFEDTLLRHLASLPGLQEVTAPEKNRDRGGAGPRTVVLVPGRGH